MNVDRTGLERWWVILVAVHSVGVGVVLVFFPRWAAGFGGWEGLSDVFFVRQGGAFHFVVALGYLMEYRRHRTVRLLLTAKAIGTAFLLAMWFTDVGGPWAIPFSALGDGAMFAVTALAFCRPGSSEGTDPRR